MPEARPMTVSALAARIRGGLEQWFPDVWVEGEVTDLSQSHAGPHAYFSVKDAATRINCIFYGAWRNPAMADVLRNGAQVRLRGGFAAPCLLSR